MNTYILPFWKKIGTSSSIIAKRVSEKLNLPTSHTGTLDPLAEGVIKIIVGEDSRNKENYISEDKTYQFKFLFGFSTDTHDALGIINSSKKIDELDEVYIKNNLMQFLGKYHQRYPNFSSKKIQGKSLWQYEREGLEVPEVYIDGEVKAIEILNFKKVNLEDVLLKIENQINLISGNFRQDEILKKYHQTELSKNLFILEVKIVMSRGLYVRGLVRDLGNKVDIPCIVLDLIRTKDGETEKKDCLSVEEYFRENLENNLNYLSPNNPS